MFIADDILLFPARSILWIFRELYNAAQEEIVNESGTLTNQLSELYMALETGRITEDEFDRQEKKILDRLDAIEANGAPDDEP
ncbi:MAG: gas vesicle protein GvpG [Desulfobacteraceae bacterium]|nr:gas vesicle protein GvpG [Desulfobacteraceae bacterium]MCF8050314.1 gas vesicle protein GvpG [Desulfobacterales bacterium]MCF8080426.1 gas vesicle protein GvpG [Desulfobacterales bacterium]